MLADDHAMVREGLAVLINAQADMEVVAQAAGGREAVDLAKSSNPDIAILDVSMPGMGGAEAAEQIRVAVPHTRILALTRHSDQGYVRNLLGAGASGYVLKKSAAETLIGAIRIVAKGGTYLEPVLAGDIVGRALGRTLGDRNVDQRDSLSVREEAVLRAIAWGRSNKEIADELSISVKTVESYKATASAKLQLRSRTDILRYALARGWLTDDTAPE